MRRAKTLLVVSCLALSGMVGCGDDQDPNGAKELWTRIHDQNYRSWARAPGYETKKPTDAPHGDSVDIYVNSVIDGAIKAKMPLTAWPEGSLIVKDAWSGSDVDAVAVMEKTGGAWFWAEYDADGTSVYSGKPSLCTDCHGSGADMVRAFGFP